MPTLQLAPAAAHSSSHSGDVSSCCYSTDGAVVLSGGWDGHLRLWDARTGDSVAAIRVSPKPVSACAVSPGGEQWLAGNLDGLLSRWDSVSQRSISNFLAHARPISAIDYSADGRLLVTSSWDCTLILWADAREREGRPLRGHTDIVAGCRFAPDGHSVLSWSHDGTVRLWDVAFGMPPKTMRGHADRVTAAAISPDGARVVSASRDRILKLWDLKTEAEPESLALPGEVRRCFFTIHGQSVGTVETSGRVRLYALPSLEVEAELTTDIQVECAELAPLGGQIALGAADGRVYFVSVEGLDGVPLPVTVTQSSRRTAGPIRRLFGKSRLTHSYHCTCPACRQQVELADKDPDRPAPCPHCRRQLRVSAVVQ